jgi:hypothetical protein
MTENSVDMITSVDERAEKIRTRALDISFNELLDMYKNRELVVQPEYQRLFRWSEGKQSRFIESLLLELPIPPIFVIEQEEGGVYELIDGLQRISSYIHFVHEHPTVTGRRLKLSDCDIVSALDGLTFDDLPRALQVKLKRSFVRMEVLRKESDPRLRYYMFKRLNTGGELLSDQEIRNCTIRLLDNTINEFIVQLSGNADFVATTINLTDDKREQRFDQELVLRFFAFKNHRAAYKHEVGDFMTEYMEGVAAKLLPFDYGVEEDAFKRTFAILNRTLGADAFSSTNESGTFISKFLNYHFEAFTLGLQPHLDRVDVDNPQHMSSLTDAFKQVKADPEFRRITTGGGKNYPNPLSERIAFVDQAVARVLA